MASSSRRSSYAPAIRSRELLKAGYAFRSARLAAGDMLSTDEAAAIAGVSRTTVNNWIAEGRAIGLSQLRRGFRLPKWQFEPSFWSVLGTISTALGVTEGWALLSFLESPHAGLTGRTPRAAIEQGDVLRVIDLAKTNGL